MGSWLCTVRPDVICLSETHITDEISDHEISFENYNIIRTNTENCRTGGVITYIQKYLKYKIITEYIIDGTWINIVQLNVKNKLIICNVYRSPRSNISNFCDKIIKLADRYIGNNNLIILGDFNIDVSKERNYSKKIIRELGILGLQQKINKPTRTTLTSNTIIDLVFTNLKLNTDVLETPKISDHNIIKLELPTFNDKNVIMDVIYRRNYKMLDDDEFKKQLTLNFNKISFKNDLVNEQDFNQSVNQIIEKINATLDITAPISKKIINYKWLNKPWIDRIVIDKMKERDRAFIFAKLSKPPVDLNEYQKLRNEVVKQLKNNKRKYFEKTIDNNKNDTIKLWKSLKQLTGNKKSDSTILKEVNFSGQIIYDKQSMANKLNKYFIDNVDKIINDIEPSSMNNCINFSIINAKWCEFKTVTYSTLNKIISNLDCNKGSNNNINAKTLKLVWESQSDVILTMMNNSLKMGLVPNDWKTSIITPIQKKKKIA